MRRLAALAGAAGLALLWLGPLPQLARASFAAHMALHMGVVAVAAPLVALALAGGRLDPARAAPALFAPIPASVVELFVVWAWHAPALHALARHAPGGLVAEQASFLAAGLLVWSSALGAGAERRAAGAVALLLTSMHMTLLGALLALASRPLYAHGAAPAVAEGLLGLGALEDQQLGGAIMLLVGGVSYLAGALGLTASLLRERAVRAPTRRAVREPARPGGLS